MLEVSVPNGTVPNGTISEQKFVSVHDDGAAAEAFLLEDEALVEVIAAI